MKEIKSILGVAISNVSSIISGIFVGFVVPKILSVEGYGFYKTFTLYVAYLGLFSLGIVDGIYLKYGAKDYSELDKPLFRAFFKWFLLIHAFFSLLAIGCSFVFISDVNTRFILSALGINLVAVNITGYFQHLSQITQRFKEYSVRKILQSVLNIVAVFLLYMIYKYSGVIKYEIYVVIVIFINYILMTWYVITYKELIIGSSKSIFDVRFELWNLIVKGFPLMFANLCSTLLLNIDRQFVSILFSTSDYAIYAFAYNMLSLVTVATSAVSTVLYPMLKRRDSNNSMTMYSKLNSAVIVMVYVIIVAYFPLNLFIHWFLPTYVLSLPIFRIILPGIAISSAVTIIMYNYYKILDEVYDYFRKSIIVLIFSAIANYFAYSLFGTMASISVASIVTMIIWYVFVERRLIAKGVNKKACWKNRLFSLLMMIAFYLCTELSNIWISMVCYIAVLIVATLLFFKNEVTLWKGLLHK